VEIGLLPYLLQPANLLALLEAHQKDESRHEGRAPQRGPRAHQYSSAGLGL